MTYVAATPLVYSNSIVAPWHRMCATVRGFPEDINYVATHASALKAHRQSLKNRDSNRQFRSRLRNALRGIRSAIDGKDVTAAKSALKETISLIDRMASKGVIHRNAAGRYKSRLTKRIAAQS